MNTSQAFQNLTSQIGWYKLCNIHPDTARSHKRFYKKGRLSMGKQFELLERAGYSHFPIKWKQPINNNR